MKDPTPTNRKLADSNDVTLYDKYDYDYSTYWASRTYEHEAEVYALNKIMAHSQGCWFVDIGGSYGRHIPIYQHRYQKCVLVDYSINSLRQASQELLKQKITNVFPVAANAYHMPFKRDVFEGGMMIRVIHHIENPDAVLYEISRTFRDNSRFILEFPNKFHLKSIIKALARADFTYLTTADPAQVHTLKPEGSRSSDPGIMLNFAPKHIRSLLSNRHISITHSSAVSFLRIPVLKQLFGAKTVIAAERVLQTFLGNTTLTPSIILSTQIHKPSTSKESIQNYEKLDDILACPSCSAELTLSGQTYSCNSCGLTFPVQYGIPDLRYPKVNS
jgi:ubiquinone/menaquinone biosynthesis C-methylase UbiE/uncharacterized protein YbaR (Trm112 family)